MTEAHPSPLNLNDHSRHERGVRTHEAEWRARSAGMAGPTSGRNSVSDTTSLAELLLGVEILPQGKRKKGLAAALTKMIAGLFGTRILSFDEPAAKLYASLIGSARAAGRIVGVAGGQIAAIAAARGFAVATRDASPFRAVGVPVINPWKE